MPKVETSWSQHRINTPQSQELEGQILEIRNEYASMDEHDNTHEFLGIVAELDHVISELTKIVERNKAQHQDVRFSLEYHPSCAIDSSSHDPVYTFTLAAKSMDQGQDTREYSFICWQFAPKTSYDQENARILDFMAQHGIDAYDDGSGETCTIQ